MTNHFRVKNFDKYQHYQDRNPTWIKLYNELLDDYEFSKLHDAAKWHLIAIWLLASRSFDKDTRDHKLPYDADWIAKRISATGKVDLEALRDAGFIVVDESVGDTTDSTEIAVAKSTKPPNTPKDRGFHIAADWAPSAHNVEYAKSKGLNDEQIGIEAELFRNYWIQKNTIKTDINWHRTWVTWVLNALHKFGLAKVGSNSGNGNRRGGSAVQATHELEDAINGGFDLPPPPV